MSRKKKATVNLIYDSSNIICIPKMFGGFRTSLLVCRGFLRRNNINPQDIDTIISKYFTIDRVTIKENKKNKVVRCVGFRK